MWVYAYQEWMDKRVASLTSESKENIEISDRALATLGLLASPVVVPLALLGCGSDEYPNETRRDSYEEDTYLTNPETEAKKDIYVPDISVPAPETEVQEEVGAVPTQENKTSWAFNGFTFTAYQRDQYCDAAFFGLVQDAWLAGADTIGLLYTRYQESLTSTEIKIDEEWTPSLDSLSCAIETVKDYGMRVALYLYVDVSDGSWRADIAPTSESLWFESFRAYITEMSQYAGDHEVDMLSVGAELHSMTKAEHIGQWQEIIKTVRDNYDGMVLYFPNQDNFTLLDMGYWQLFDAIGINFWSYLSDKAVPEVNELAEAWETYIPMITSKAATVGKKIFFGEIGYPSREYCASDPYACTKQGVLSGTCQSNAYEAFYQVWGMSEEVMGALFWQVGLGDKGYDPNMCDEESSGCCPFEQVAEAVFDPWM